MKKAILLLMCVFLLCGCGDGLQSSANLSEEMKNAKVINLAEDKASYDNKDVAETDYVWHLNTETGEEYFTGNEITDSDVYIAHDIVYYPEFAETDFVKENYDGETEWVNHYKNDELKDYILTTLPALSDSVPKEMMHSEEAAYNNPVLHITKAGDYVLQGSWHGQILIDLGKDAFSDETAKVRLFLNGASVSCDVAPALIFKNVFEADNTWEDRKEYTSDVDISNAGASVIICDGTENNFIGANVFRILKPEYKKEGSTVQKKRYKIDGAFYSYESMLISGEKSGTGILNITSSTYEGLDCELHMTINSGHINIVSQDDGINVNEDDVSVFTMNGGRLTIFAGQGAEGDVIDSNGFIKVNGGTILGTSPSMADEILDAEKPVEVSDDATIISSLLKNGQMPGQGGNPPEMPGGNQPMMPNGNQQGTPSGNPPEMPSGNQQGTPSGNPPEMPGGNQPGTPDGNPPEKPSN